METKRALSLLHCNALEEVIRRSPNVGQRNERAKIGRTNESSEVTCVDGQMYHKHYSSLLKLYVLEFQLSDYNELKLKKFTRAKYWKAQTSLKYNAKRKYAILDKILASIGKQISNNTATGIVQILCWQRLRSSSF